MCGGGGGGVDQVGGGGGLELGGARNALCLTPTRAQRLN